MTPLIAPPPQPVPSVVEINEVVDARMDVELEYQVRVVTSGDGVTFSAAEPFDDDQRIFEPGITYGNWTGTVAPAADGHFADKLDFLEFLD